MDPLNGVISAGEETIKTLQKDVEILSRDNKRRKEENDLLKLKIKTQRDPYVGEFERKKKLESEVSTRRGHLEKIHKEIEDLDSQLLIIKSEAYNKFFAKYKECLEIKNEMNRVQEDHETNMNQKIIELDKFRSENNKIIQEGSSLNSEINNLKGSIKSIEDQRTEKIARYKKALELLQYNLSRP